MAGGYSNRSVSWIGKESLYVSAVERRYLRTQPYMSERVKVRRSFLRYVTVSISLVSIVRADR
jgi:hypothetical protein